MLYHFELQMAGVILLTTMAVCGVSLWIKRRKAANAAATAATATTTTAVSAGNDDDNAGYNPQDSLDEPDEN